MQNQNYISISILGPPPLASRFGSELRSSRGQFLFFFLFFRGVKELLRFLIADRVVGVEREKLPREGGWDKKGLRRAEVCALESTSWFCTPVLNLISLEKQESRKEQRRR